MYGYMLSYVRAFATPWTVAREGPLFMEIYFQARIREWVAISYSNCCLQIVVVEKTPESPLDSKELEPVNLNRNKP